MPLIAYHFWQRASDQMNKKLNREGLINYELAALNLSKHPYMFADKRLLLNLQVLLLISSRGIVALTGLFVISWPTKLETDLILFD